MLAEFQRQFLRRLYFNEPFCCLSVAPGARGASPQRCLDAYRGSLYGTLSKALGEIYPVCVAFVGARFFNALATRYIHSHPSRAERLDDYGATFADFCAGFAPAQAVPQLPALARLEWAWHRAFHARDAQPFDFERFARASATQAQRIRFQPAHALTLLAADFPVDRLWRYHQPDWPPAAALRLEGDAVRLAVLRPQAQVRIERLSETEWHFLHQLLEDGDLSGLCERLGEAAVVCLPRAIERGWIGGFTLEDDDEGTV